MTVGFQLDIEILIVLILLVDGIRGFGLPIVLALNRL